MFMKSPSIPLFQRGKFMVHLVNFKVPPFEKGGPGGIYSSARNLTK
jgi:hypothetical protein